MQKGCPRTAQMSHGVSGGDVSKKKDDAWLAGAGPGETWAGWWASPNWSLGYFWAKNELELGLPLGQKKRRPNGPC